MHCSCNSLQTEVEILHIYHFDYLRPEVIMVPCLCAGNGITQSFFLPITLIACMVGLASVLAGVHHVRLFRSDSLAAAAATSLIAWLLVLLAMGYVLLSNFPSTMPVCRFSWWLSNLKQIEFAGLFHFV